jgi:hypothetical protein
MHYLESALRVLVTGLIFGAGLPATFAVGVKVYSAGVGGIDTNGAIRAPNPVWKAAGVALFGFVAVVILVAILWITRNSINHHLGIDLFPFLHKK